MTKALACIDVSAYAVSVTDHAAWVATRTNGAVSILHVIGRKERGEMLDLSGALGIDANSHLLECLAEADEKNARLAQERGRALIETAKSRLADQGVADVSVKFRHGSFTDTVAESEADVDLIVIGKRGANADFATMHLGSNLERVVRAAKKPILVAARAFRPVNRVLLAYDGGASARKALDYMAGNPLFGGLEFHVVTAAADTAENRALLGEAAAALGRRGGPVTSRLLPGDPEAVIANHVRQEGIDLLVMGAYGHSKVRNLLVGSTTAATIRTCLVPVMLFR